MVHAVQQLADAKRRGHQRQPAGLDLGQIEDVVDQGQQGFGRAFGLAQVVELHLVQRRALEQFQHAQNAVHRRAHLVAHIGQELALGLAGGFGLLGAQLQFFVLDLQLAPRPVQIGHVDHDAEDPREPAFAQVGRAAHQHFLGIGSLGAGIDDLEGLPGMAMLALLAGAPVHALPDVVVKAQVRALAGKVPGVPADQIALRQTRHLAQGGVGRQDDAISVGGEDAFGGLVVDLGGQTQLALAVLACLALGVFLERALDHPRQHDQVVARHFLDAIVDGATAQGPHGQHFVAGTGHHDHRRRALAQALGQLRKVAQAVAVRQVKVQQDDVGPLLLQLMVGFTQTAGGQRRPAAVLQRAADGDLIALAVVNDENDTVQGRPPLRGNKATSSQNARSRVRASTKPAISTGFCT